SWRVDLAVSSAKVKPGAPLTATVTTKGGMGVIGVMLTDNDQRYQSSPVQVQGFIITKDPDVTGPDGKPQTTFLDGREPGLSRGINYVNIQNVKSDTDANTYDACKVVYTLSAPMTPGDYTISAAFIYGTETASAIGRQETPDGRVMPAGGQGSGSGRIAFAKMVKVTEAKRRGGPKGCRLPRFRAVGGTSACGSIVLHSIRQRSRTVRSPPPRSARTCECRRAHD